MSWIKIPMKFPGTCIVCNDKIEINEIGLWSKGVGCLLYTSDAADE